MPFFPSLPADAGVRKLWETFNPKAREGLSIFSRSFMRNEGRLTPGDKEMIAAYVSRLNDSDTASPAIRGWRSTLALTKACSRPSPTISTPRRCAMS